MILKSHNALDIDCPYCGRGVCICTCTCKRFGSHLKPHRRCCWCERRHKQHCFVVDEQGQTHTTRSAMVRRIEVDDE